MGSFLDDSKDKVRDPEQERLDLKFEMQSIDNQLRESPTCEEIRTKREWIRKQLMLRTMESYFTGGHMFNTLFFESKRKIVTLVFGGKDQNGKHYGIYIRPLGGNPKRYWFVAYRRLGSVYGWVKVKQEDIRQIIMICGPEGTLQKLRPPNILQGQFGIQTPGSFKSKMRVKSRVQIIKLIWLVNAAPSKTTQFLLAEKHQNMLAIHQLLSLQASP